MNLHLPERRRLMTSVLVTGLGGCALPRPPDDPALLERQVRDTEEAFAATMARRDHAAFTGFLAEEAIFINGGQPLRGKAAIAAHWERFYTGAAAPFAWKPDLVQVLDSGQLAWSTGPVTGADGKLIARFQSTWRREASGVWRIVFDNGCTVCRCEA